MDRTLPRYTQAEVIKASRCSPKHLQNWIDREIFVPQDFRPGKGQRRKYSAFECVHLALVSHLCKFGVTPGQATYFGWHFARRWANDGQTDDHEFVVIQANSEQFRGEVFRDGEEGRHSYERINCNPFAAGSAAFLLGYTANPRDWQKSLSGFLGGDPSGDTECALVLAVGRTIRHVAERLAAIDEQRGKEGSAA